jgi:hypothetical protein
MLRNLLITLVLLPTSLLCQQKLSPRRLAAPPIPAPAPVAQSVAPLRPEQMPASQPDVQFRQGQLMIMASNATLGDILRAVHQETGATVDVPPNATERVVGQFGPGPARDVLTSLLNGSHFNYVLLGAADNPTALDRVILTSRSGNDQMAQSPSATQNQQYQSAVMAQPADTDDTSADDAAADADNNAEADEQANQAQTADDQQQQQQQQANPFGQQGGVKTPEQLLQELQQRQQQMQQQGVTGYPPPGVQRPQQQ